MDENVTRTRETLNVYKILVGRSLGELGIYGRRLRGILKKLCLWRGLD
jgi:hypothetical protein